MKYEIQNTPQLRFPGFEGEWKVDELGNNAKVTSGGTPSRNKKNFWNGNIPWITTSLINFNVINTAEEFITQDAVLKSSAKIEKMLGKNGLGVIRKAFGVVLLAIAVKLFAANVKGLFV